MKSADNERAEAILEFWFGPLLDDGKVDAEHSARWWRKDPAFDERIVTEFLADMERAARGELDAWKESPRGRLALVILLDQFSRNAFRNTPGAFSNDARAQAIAEEGVALGHDRELRPSERTFLYMPLVHAEDRAAQERAVELFRRANEELGGLETYLKFAILHHDIVMRFGRFPHRNAILGRTSTPEELAFLEQPGSSF